MTPLLCLAIALHDVDGPIRCATGERIRLEGIGARELDGSCRPGQPCPPGDPYDQRLRFAASFGAFAADDDRRPGRSLWFQQSVTLRCQVTGRSHDRLVARCSTSAGVDLSCLAIRLRVAERWPKFDPSRRLVRCRG